MDISKHFTLDLSLENKLRGKDGKPAGSRGNTGWQVHVTVNGHRYRTSSARVIWELYHGKTIPEKFVIMQRDGDVFNVEPENLVCVARSYAHIAKAKPYVRRSSGGKFWSSIAIEGKRIYLGSYTAEQEAIDAYNAKRQEVLESIF